MGGRALEFSVFQTGFLEDLGVPQRCIRGQVGENTLGKNVCGDIYTYFPLLVPLFPACFTHHSSACIYEVGWVTRETSKQKTLADVFILFVHLFSLLWTWQARLKGILLPPPAHSTPGMKGQNWPWTPHISISEGCKYILCFRSLRTAKHSFRKIRQ